MMNTRADFERTGIHTAVLPVGATEQHGSHLPVGTDTVIAEALARRLGEKLDAYVLPGIAISSSIEHRHGLGTVYLRADTLALVIRDIAFSLQHSGASRMVIVNWHGGNWILKPTVRQLNRELATMSVILIHPSVARHRAGEVLESPEGDIHAGEKETSIMMHLAPDCVKEPKPVAHTAIAPQEYMDYFDVMELTEDGVWGYPEAASREKGRKMLDLLTESALDYVRDWEQIRARVSSRASGSKSEA